MKIGKNLRKKRLENRRLRLEKEKSRKYERFLRIQKEKLELKESIKKQAKDRLYEETDGAKCALSAYKFAETLREREKQIEFNKKIREIEVERERENIVKIYKDVELYNKEEEGKKQRVLERKKELNKENIEILKQLEKQRLKNKELHEAEEREELELIKKEIKEIHENERKEKERKKNIIRQELLENRQVLENQMKIRQAEEKEEDEALMIIANAKRRMAKIRKEKEDQMKATAIERRDKIALSVAAMQESKEDKEEKMYRKARAENEAMELKILENRRNHIMALRQDRLNEHNKYLVNEEKRKQKEAELMKWNMLQRFKKEELNRQFKSLMDDKRKQSLLEVRENNLKQIEEIKQKRKASIEADVLAVQRASDLWKIEDEKLFNFVNELKKDCHEVGRPTFPLDNALCAYKKRMGLLELPPQHRIWKSNLPVLDLKQNPVNTKKPPHRNIYKDEENTKWAKRDIPLVYVNSTKRADGLQEI